MTSRLCPSCRARLSALAVECPVCGLAFSNPAQRKPLLFQASALAGRPLDQGQAPRPALKAPALGRVAVVQVEAGPEELARLSHPLPDPEPPGDPEAPRPTLGEASTLSLWPLVALEAAEALLLAAVTALSLGLTSLLLGTSIARLALGAWIWVWPFLFLLCWATIMTPLVLASQSPFMPFLGLVVAEDQPLKRLNFSLLHLISVTLFPLSFLCLVLSPRHQTLGELLSGAEIIARPTPRLR